MQPDHLWTQLKQQIAIIAENEPLLSEVLRSAVLAYDTLEDSLAHILRDRGGGGQRVHLHEVTLGGTGKETGDRHPKVSDGVLIGAGAKILGNVRIGEGAKVGAGSVVLMDVPAHTTVAGVPAEVVGRPRVSVPSLHMDHSIEIDRMSVGAGPRRVGGGG